MCEIQLCVEYYTGIKLEDFVNGKYAANISLRR